MLEEQERVVDVTGTALIDESLLQFESLCVRNGAQS